MTADINRPVARFDLYSHYVKVTRFDHLGKTALQEFSYNLISWGMERRGQHNVRVEKCVYKAMTADEQEWRFHINQLEDLFRRFESYGMARERIEVVRHAMYTPPKVEYTFKSEMEPRESQPMIIDYLSSPPKEGYAPSKLVTLQTGKGKGFVTFKALERLGVRALITVKGMFVDKWLEESDEMFDLKPGDMVEIDSSKTFRKFILAAKAGEPMPKLIVVSTKLMYLFMQTYELYNGNTLAYEVAPEEIWELFGIGVHITDEAHMEAHCVFRMDLFSHVPLAIFLSATVESDDKFMNGMYAIQWPIPMRSPYVPYDKYINVKNIWYTVDDMKGIRYRNHMKQYSHVMYEQSIMKRPRMLDNYYAMNRSIMNTIFFGDREVGQRALLYCATKEMCTIFRDRFQRDYPNLKIGRYIDVDPLSTLEECDMTVTTVKSAGTAVDIDGLVRVLNTHNMSSRQAVEQAVGRLRKPKRWAIDPEYYTISARNIDAHNRYAADQPGKINDKIKSYSHFQSQFRV